MSDSERTSGNPGVSPESQRAITRCVHYEQERLSAVTLAREWPADRPGPAVEQLLDVIRGAPPERVYLAELPPASHWTRKLKLTLPALPGREVSVIGAGAPRLLLDGHVAYLLPIPAAKWPGATYQHVVEGTKVREERLTYEEVLGGLSAALGEHIQQRMAQADRLTGDSGVVPETIARGSLGMPGWRGAFLIYAAPENEPPTFFLRPDVRHRIFDGKRGVDLFQAGVQSLFHTLRALNVREGGLFHGDLVHRIRGGSANLGFTREGAAVITGWGHRRDESVADWPPDEFRLQQMREVAGALAGLLGDILAAWPGGEHQHRLLIDTVVTALEEYTGRRGGIDRVAIGAGLPSDVDRFTQAAPLDWGDIGERERALQGALADACGQLEEPIRRWLIKGIEEQM